LKRNDHGPPVRVDALDPISNIVSKNGLTDICGAVLSNILILTVPSGDCLIMRLAADEDEGVGDVAGGWGGQEIGEGREGVALDDGSGRT